MQPDKVEGEPRTEPSPPRDVAVPARDDAFAVCVDLTASGPRSSVEAFIAAAHSRIAAPLRASSGHLAISFRSAPVDDDPLGGWRLPVFYAIGSRSREEIRAVEREMTDETYVHDPVVRALVRDAGRHRVYHDPDPRTVRERAGTLDEKYWTLLGLVDRLKLVYALAPDVEIHMAFDRVTGASRFERHDVLLLEDTLRGLRPWARRLALLHGYLDGQTPLSPREREMACALLGHAQLKAIAAELRMSEARARELVRAVYRKLGVKSRTELASVWAGETSAAATQPVATSRGRGRRR